MTLISRIISRHTAEQQSILFDTEYKDILASYCQDYELHDIKNINIFGKYDILFIDQSNIGRVRMLYQKYFCDIYVIDNMTKHIDETAISSYNNDLIELYEHYRTAYNAVFISVDNLDYVKTNYAHDLDYNIREPNQWKRLLA